MRAVQDDVQAVSRIAVVPTILEAMAHLTGMRFTAVARVTDSTWTACAVRDRIAFGLRAGDELKLETTICNEIRQHGEAVLFGSASTDPRFQQHPTPRRYGFESYVSIPIVLDDGSFFGTLCAIDPEPAKLDDPNLLRTLELFSQLIALHLSTQDQLERRNEALAAAADSTQRLDRENQRVAALMHDREEAESAIRRELKDTRRLRELAARLIGPDDDSAVFNEILAAAVEITDADAGTIQLLDPATQILTILSSHAIGPAMLSHFAQVDASSGSPCGIALSRGERAFIVFDDPDQPDPDGSSRFHLDSGLRCAQSTPLLSRSGRPIGMFSTHWRERRELTEREVRFLDLLGRQAADLIERTQAQQALLARERELREAARRKDEFLAVLAHELRNPLAPIRSGIDLLKHAQREPQLVAQIQPMMERQVGQLVRLVDDLLDVSRITSGRVELRRESIALGSLIDSAVEAHRGALSAAGLELKITIDSPEQSVEVDPTRISQVISNILHNAIKFTDAGGTITIRSEILCTEAPSELALHIADTGIGIREDQLPSIFELFTQVRPDSSMRHGGMGIGLALARSLVELHGGTLTAASRGADQGSQFTIRIPLSEAKRAETKTDPAVAADPLTGLKVLVVDDNQDAADAMALLIAACGGEVRTVYDGPSALELMRAFEPALVLLDLGMPEIDGYQACRQIRLEKGIDVRVVAVSGWGQEDDRRRAEEAGFDAHLTKPVDFVQLARIAQSVRANAAIVK